MVGVLSFGRGLFDREPIVNGKTSYRVFYRLKTDHVVMSQLFGWEGALALSSEKFAGKFLSPQFPTFLCVHNKLDRQFLGWLMRRRTFWQDLGTRTSGMGDRRRTLTPDALFACEIPLPPLSEQRRIVARIEDLVALENEARALRQLSTNESEALVTSIHLSLADTRTRTMREMFRLDEEAVPVMPNEEYPQVGVRSFGSGLFKKVATKGTDTSYKFFNRLYSGALVLSQVKGWEGAIAVAEDDMAGWFVSPEYRTFRCSAAEAIPAYVAALVRTEWFWSRLSTATRGVGARRERTRPESFLNIEIPMPDITRQKKAVAVYQQLSSLKSLQQETAKAMDTLLPAILDRAFKGKL